MEGHAVYATRDQPVAEVLGRPLLGPHRLHVDGGASFSGSLHAVPVGRATIGYLAFGPKTDVVLAAPPRLLVVVTTAAAAEVRVADRWAVASPRTAVVLPPGSPATIRGPASAVHLVVGIEHQALLGHLSRLLGRPLDRPLAFDLELDLLAGASARWNAAVDILHAELSEPRSLLRSGIGLSQIEEFLMSSLLFGHRSTYSAALRAPGQGAPDHLPARAATEFIERHLDRPLSVTAVAAAVGMSTRTLQATFRSELRTTPTAYVRDRRLDRVRAELAEAAVVGGATVTEIATRWGITHLGRFAGEYRARFGESPSQTLRASVAAPLTRIPSTHPGYRQRRPPGRPHAKEEAVADELGAAE